VSPVLEIRNDGIADGAGTSETVVVTIKPDANDVPCEFLRIARLLDRCCKEFAETGLDPVVRISAEVFYGRFDVFTNSNSIESIVGLLVLAFPDVRFQFTAIKLDGTADADNQSARDVFQRLAEVETFPGSFSPLFDPVGLRSWLLWRAGLNALRRAPDSDNRVLLANRFQRRDPSDNPPTPDAPAPFNAIVLEDESEYAMFCGYTCYRFGYLTQTLGSWDAAKYRLSSTINPPYLAIQDIWLNFSSYPDNFRLEDLDVRYAAFPKLKEAHKRVTISTGDWPDSVQQRQLPEILVRKPFAGMFGFWRDAWNNTSDVRVKPNALFASTYGAIIDSSETDASARGRHSAPERVMLLAEFMLQRAREILRDVVSMRQAVKGAVLASDALDLLAGHAVTTSFEALSLKHQFEVMCECRFMAVRMEISADERFNELEASAKRLARNVAENDRSSAQNNSLMEIATEIARVFRDNVRFQEEQDALAYHRRYFQLFLRSQRDIFAKVKGKLLLYPHFLLESFRTFILTLMVLLGLSTIFHICLTSAPEFAQHCHGGVVRCYFQFFVYTCAAFLNIELWPDNHFMWRFWTVLLGIPHLGVLLAYGYNLVNRK